MKWSSLKYFLLFAVLFEVEEGLVLARDRTAPYRVLDRITIYARSGLTESPFAFSKENLIESPQFRLEMRNQPSIIPRIAELLDALRDAKSADAKEFSVHWLITIKSNAKEYAFEAYCDKWGRAGYLNGKPVEFTPKFRQWIKKYLSASFDLSGYGEVGPDPILQE